MTSGISRPRGADRVLVLTITEFIFEPVYLMFKDLDFWKQRDQVDGHEDGGAGGDHADGANR